VSTGGVCRQREHASALQVLLKPTMRRGGPGDSHSIINDWGGAWEIPNQVRVVPESSIVNLRCSIFFSMSPKHSLL
jgi:hypothetical protein